MSLQFLDAAQVLNAAQFGFIDIEEDDENFAVPYDGEDDNENLGASYDGASQVSSLKHGTGGVNSGLAPQMKKARLSYHCEPCDSSFTEMRALIRHEQTQQHLRKLGLKPSGGFRCEICGQSFTRSYDRSRHQKRRHDDAVGRMPRFAVPLITDNVSHSTQVREEMALEHSSMYSFPDTTPENVTCSTSDDTTKDSSSVESCTSTSCVTICNEIADTAEDGDSKGDPKGIKALRSAETMRGAIPKGVPIRTKKFATHRNYDITTVPARKHCFCSMCQRPFEIDDMDLAEHVRQHVDDFLERNGEYRCDVCEVTFIHKADFQYHQRSVYKGLCGFKFEFTDVHPWTGQPLLDHDCLEQPDSDAFKSSTTLRHWEQAQLQTFRLALDEVVTARQRPETGAFSIEVARRMSRDTLASLPISVKTYASAPCDRDKAGKFDVLGLQRRLRILTLRNRRIRDNTEPPLESFMSHVGSAKHSRENPHRNQAGREDPFEASLKAYGII